MIVLGFDPGGGKKFGCAILNTKTRKIVSHNACGVDAALEWIQSNIESQIPFAAGIDTLLFWQTTKAGWRGADEYLRKKYPEQRNSVSASNSLYGAMAVQGAVLAYQLQTLWPQIYLTETHPKILWSHFNPELPYQREWGNGVTKETKNWLNQQKINIDQNIDEDQFDAVLSAWAAEKFFVNKDWKIDLKDELASEQKTKNISLLRNYYYGWPE